MKDIQGLLGKEKLRETNGEGLRILCNIHVSRQSYPIPKMKEVDETILYI